jgi:hypothetical protein
MGYREVVKIHDQKAIRTGRQNSFRTIEIKQAEVFFPRIADITFPLRNARDGAINTGRDFWHKLKNQEASVRNSDDAALDDDTGDREEDNVSSGSGITRPETHHAASGSSEPPAAASGSGEPTPAASGSGEGPEIGTNTRSARITINRMIDFGPTIGVPGVLQKVRRKHRETFKRLPRALQQRVQKDNHARYGGRCSPPQDRCWCLRDTSD